MRPLPRARTIRARLLTILLATIVILAGISAGIWRLALKPALSAGVERTREEIAGRSADRIGAFIEQRISELEAATDYGLFWEGRRDRQREILRQLMKSSPAVAEVTVADRSGREVLRVSRSRLYTDADLGSLAGQEKFDEPLLGETYIGEVYHAPTAEPYMTLAVPIKFTPRETGGVLVAEINLKALWDPISHVQVGQASTVYVMDRRGRLLAHRDYSKVLLGTIITHLPEVLGAAAAANPSVGPARVTPGPDGRELLVASAIVSRPQWLVVVEEPVETALEGVRQVERLAFGLMLATLAGGSSFAVWFSGRIARPVRQLEEGAAIIARGHLGHRLEISTGDEIQRLAEEFNEMANQLQASRKDLELRVEERTEESEIRRQRAEALFEITRAISQSLDPDLVARQIVDRALALFRAMAATVYRFEAETGNLVAIASAGDLGTGPDTLRVLPSGTGVTGAAVRERRPVVTPDLLVDPQISLSAESRAQITRARFRAGLAVPLLIKDQVIGALGIGDTAGRIFDDEQIQLAQALASQAAVALENARLYRNAQETLEELSRTQGQLVQAQKMEAVGRLAGGIAHDFNNLLTVINGRAQLVLDRMSDDSRDRGALELIQKTSDRAAALTRQLLAFSRKQILQPKVLDLNAVVSAVVPMLGRLIGEDIALVFEPGPRLAKIKADSGQLEQVILNLVVNARDAMPEGGKLTLETANATLDAHYSRQHGGVEPGAYVMLAVSDTGIGMDGDTQARIFEPFFTTKGLGEGTGLGLSTVYGIVKQSGGSIWVYSEPGKGATFKVYLPRTEDLEEAPEQLVSSPQGGVETVLLVEDEDDLRELVSEILQNYGYTVLVASRAREAEVLAERYDGPIQLVLTDVVMPEMSGRALVGQLAPRRPDMRVLYMSGYTDHAIVHHGSLDPDTHFIQKPFAPDELARKVREVLDAPAARAPVAPSTAAR